MSAEQRRHTSKLAGRSILSAAPEDAEPPVGEEPTPPKVPAVDNRVGFNCKMDRELRRAVRRFAVDHDMGLQDLVDEALREYLSARGAPDR